MTAVLDEIIDGAVSGGKIAGAVILVAREGRIVFRRCAGFLDREAGTAMPEDAVFRLSSLTKPITSAAAMVLVERGLLALNDRRVTRDGVIIIKAQEYRTQEQNRAAAIERLEALIASVCKTRKVRVATRPTRASQRRRLESKAQRGEVKAGRGRVSE